MLRSSLIIIISSLFLDDCNWSYKSYYFFLLRPSQRLFLDLKFGADKPYAESAHIDCTKLVFQVHLGEVKCRNRLRKQHTH